MFAAVVNACRSLCPRCDCGSVLAMNIECALCRSALRSLSQSISQSSYLSATTKGLVLGLGASVVVAGQFYDPTTYEELTASQDHSFGALTSPLNTECSICLDEFQPTDSVIHTACAHTFHTACLREWREPSCPNCRAERE